MRTEPPPHLHALNARMIGDATGVRPQALAYEVWELANRRERFKARAVILGLALALNCVLWALLLIGARAAWLALTPHS